MSRLLLLTLDYPPKKGGVARYLSAFASFFGTRVQVAVLDQPSYLNMIRKLWRRRKSYDTVVVSHVLPVGTAAHAASFLTRKPYVVIVHGMDIGLVQKNLWKKWLAGHVMRHAKLVIANSKALEREVREVFGVERTTLAYPPVTRLMGAEAGVPGARSVALSDPPGRSEDDGVGRSRGPMSLLTVARLVERKGHLRVLRAIADCRDIVSEYRIIGSGPMEQAIRDEVKRLGLEGIVKMETNADDAAVIRAYENADILVMPTVGNADDREGFGMVYIEAAAFGVPSIASALPGVDEAVIDGETGILVTDGSHEALVAAIRQLADPSQREKLGENARQRVSREFTPQQSFGKLETIL